MNKFNFLYFLFLVASFALPACAQKQTQDQKAPPLEVQIGQMLSVGFRGLQVADTNHVVRDIKKYHLGGVILFDYDVPSGSPLRNIKSPAQVKKLVRQLQGLSDRKLFVAVDQEGGKIARLTPRHGFPKTVSAQYLGSLNNVDSTRFYARRMAKTLSQLGINVDLAPVVDLNVNPKNPVIGSLNRSFSADPKVVYQQARAFIKSLHKQHVLTVLKHFPGHGSSKKDSHKGVVDVSRTWSKKELVPYRKLINNDMADMIMTAHIFNTRWDSTYPATLSKKVIDGMLRDSLHYEGVIVSDDMMMGAIRKEYGLKTAIQKTIQAGVDIITFANNSVYDPDIVPKAEAIIKKLIKEHKISRQRIYQSYRRIIKLKKRLSPNYSQL